MTDFWKDYPALERRLERVVAAIDATVDGPGFPLKAAIAATAEANGKLLRPALLIIGSSFGRASDSARIERLAAAIELLHVATLVHDDIIDEAPIRRGRPSLHASIGVKEAVLAGDWLFSRCFLLSSESAEPESARNLARLIAAICSAEISQDMDKYRFVASIRAYLRTIAGKTAALFSLALHAGASEAKADTLVIRTLRRAGYDIGMAFQVIDDILDFESSEDVMRKPVGHDVAEGLCTLPLIYALRADEAAMRSLLERLPRNSPAGHIGRSAEADEAISAILARSHELGGVESARRVAMRFTRRAQSEIARLPAGAPRDNLARVAEKLLSRKS
jgi:heptaprenyl diphosphate synthase